MHTLSNLRTSVRNLLKYKVLVVSPEYLHYYGFRSATTGKRFPRLKPGTVLMGEHLWKKILGMEGSTDGCGT